MTRIARTILLVALAALSSPVAARDLQEVLNTGTLRVGVTLFPPWATRAGNGELVGFEIDVAKQLAADLGVKAELSAYDVERLVPALEAGEIDLIAAGLTITPERALHVNFSQPYADAGIALATHLERTANVADLALWTAGVLDRRRGGTVAVQLARRLLPRASSWCFPRPTPRQRSHCRGSSRLSRRQASTFLAIDPASSTCRLRGRCFSAGQDSP
jgi:polar amino acid transport system substrate-binding protein